MLSEKIGPTPVRRNSLCHTRTVTINHVIRLLLAASCGLSLLLVVPAASSGADRTLRGTVMGHEGAITVGDGWTAKALGNGRYRVDFSVPFPEPPTVVLTIHGNPAGFSHTISIDDGEGGVTNAGFRAYLSEGAHAANVAENFTFIVIGSSGQAPVVTLRLTGCTTCKAGDTFSVNATVKNLATKPVSVEVKAGVVFPDSRELNLWVVPDRHFEVTLAAGLDTTVELLRATVPPGLPTGVWVYEGVLLSPELGHTLARDTQSFTVQ